jgi:hypothetical protein
VIVPVQRPLPTVPHPVGDPRASSSGVWTVGAPPHGPGRVWFHLVAAVVFARAGEPERARQELDLARGHAGKLDLLETSELVQWTRRAERVATG